MSKNKGQKTCDPFPLALPVEDPYGGQYETYEQVFEQLTRMIDKLKSKLVTE
ncbi:hypothetical protein QS430_07495 [Staphylococcus pseudintermedius]|nr:hypothetical protein QS430_07495 [Staphylococcus pseudintermedius]